MEKINLKKKYKSLYMPSAKKVTVVDVPEFNFVMVDGLIKAGEPVQDSPEFQDATSALYGVSYALKFMSKKRPDDPIDYTVMALEGLWWVESGIFEFGKIEPWFFTLMMMQPGHITEEMYQEALVNLQKKKDNPALAQMRFEGFHEGPSIQIMHLGPYAEEPRSLEKMDAFAQENGYSLHGKHHEIYIGDPRRANPEKLKTILRHPAKKAP